MDSIFILGLFLLVPLVGFFVVWLSNRFSKDRQLSARPFLALAFGFFLVQSAHAQWATNSMGSWCSDGGACEAGSYYLDLGPGCVYLNGGGAYDCGQAGVDLAYSFEHSGWSAMFAAMTGFTDPSSGGGGPSSIGTLAGATNNSVSPVAAGIANGAASVFYVLIPAALLVGLVVWGWRAGWRLSH